MRVPIADILDNPAKGIKVIWHSTLFDQFTIEVAQYPTEATWLKKPITHLLHAVSKVKTPKPVHEQNG